MTPRTAQAACTRSASFSASSACLKRFRAFSSGAERPSSPARILATCSAKPAASSAWKFFTVSSWAAASSPGSAILAERASAFCSSSLLAAASASAFPTAARSPDSSWEPRDLAHSAARALAASASLSSLSTPAAASCTSAFLASRSRARTTDLSMATIARSRCMFSNGTPLSSVPRLLMIFSTCSLLGANSYSLLAKESTSREFRWPSWSMSCASKMSFCSLAFFSSVVLRRTCCTAALSSSILDLQLLNFPCRHRNSAELFILIAASVLPISFALSPITLAARCTAAMASSTAASVAVAASSAISCVTSLEPADRGLATSSACAIFSSAALHSSKTALASCWTLSGSGRDGSTAGVAVSSPPGCGTKGLSLRGTTLGTTAGAGAPVFLGAGTRTLSTGACFFHSGSASVAWRAGMLSRPLLSRVRCLPTPVERPAAATRPLPWLH
mmetsp:Transcript_87713/g.266134  ORF Transcript_87713/g.266134 Transcript_87713/m.266134 type:complete len:447 (-) Transcript_87713:76-1416(-)